MPDTLVKDEVPVSILMAQDMFYVSVYVDGVTFLDRSATFGVLTSSVAAALGSQEIIETPSGVINGTNLTFVLSRTPTVNSLRVFKNGLLQDISSDGDLTVAGTVLTFNAGLAPLPGDKLKAAYHF